MLTIGLARADQHLWRALCGRGASRLTARFLDISRSCPPGRPSCSDTSVVSAASPAAKSALQSSAGKVRASASTAVWPS